MYPSAIQNDLQVSRWRIQIASSRWILSPFLSFLVFCGVADAQTFFGHQSNPFDGDNLFKFTLNCACTGCSVMEYIGPTGHFGEQLTMSPEGHLFGYDGDLYRIDTLTGTPSLYCVLPDLPLLGLLSVGGGIFYSMLEQDVNHADTLLEINANTGTVTVLGRVPYTASGDMMMYNGEIYYLTIPDVFQVTYRGIAKVDPADPEGASLVIIYSTSYGFLGITASNICNTFIGADLVQDDQLVYINIIDGAITPLFEDPVSMISLASMQEFVLINNCNTVDLDCNDSSGATDGDFNGITIDCYTGTSHIADEDISMTYDSLIMEMRIRLTGVTPDAPNEYLELTGPVYFMGVTGNGTDEIILTNEGFAYSKSFEDALKLIVYKNETEYPTGGLRTIEVQFTTSSGAVSTVATAYINVNELPLLSIDLGPDLILCDGESATFNAGNPGAYFHWSTGAGLQSITVNQPGQYIVTVSTSENCPNQDTVNLQYIPNAFVSLDGDTEICIDDIASLTLHIESAVLMTIEILPVPGTAFTIQGTSGNYNFSDLLSVGTQYVITEVSHNLPACLEVTDSVHTVEVFPTYAQYVEVTLCEGDSILIGYDWESEAGEYDHSYYTEHGCDSLVTTKVSVLPVETISIQATTCDPSAAGIFYDFLENANGCDTILKTVVELITSDTTLISRNTCSTDSAGITTLLLSNQGGCDSLVITILTASPPMDTTLLFETTCDSTLLGNWQYPLTGIDGCDSLVMITVIPDMPDTTYQFTTSCDSASLGVFHTHFTSTYGCDSTVTKNVAYSASDSTFILTNSCDPGQAGMTVQNLVNRFGCDSIVTMITSLATSDSLSITSATCDPSAAGMFVYHLLNQHGCDSIVTETVNLLPSDETSFFASTCHAAETGTFITSHLNQYGCDSIVTLTISLVATDTTLLNLNTCHPAEVGTSENLYVAQDGCDSLVIEISTLYPLPELVVAVTSDYMGHDISCFGESDGSVAATVTGEAPFTYIWSTGETDPGITGLESGSYTVTVTDDNGCEAEDSVILFDPESFSITFEVSQPDCFDINAGTITVHQTGGAAPFSYSMDGIHFQSSESFLNLSGGTYQITARDANACEVTEILWINVPLLLDVDLGEDQVILLGDTAIIHAIVNMPYDSLSSVVWSGISNTPCPNCLVQPVAPVITTTYTISVTNMDGCNAEDAMSITVERSIDIYVPNIFSPNGDNINDLLVINAGSEIREIVSIDILDRWGNLVFSATHFQANDPNYGWDGTTRDKALNSGVFAYKLIALFKDGTQEIRVGDVTLIR